MSECFQMAEVSKQMIVNAISTSLTLDYPDHVAILDSPTNNSGPFAKWDILNRHLENSFQGSNIEIQIVHRGPWYFALLYDYDNNSVFSLMRSERFKQLSEEKNINSLHYLFSLAEKNDGYTSYPGQLTLFTMNSNDVLREKRHQIRESLLSMGGENVKFYGTILFKERNGILSSVEYRVVNSIMDTLYQESLNKYIQIGFAYPDSRSLDLPERANEITRPVLVRRKDQSSQDAK